MNPPSILSAAAYLPAPQVLAKAAPVPDPIAYLWPCGKLFVSRVYLETLGFSRRMHFLSVWKPTSGKNYLTLRNCPSPINPMIRYDRVKLRPYLNPAWWYVRCEEDVFLRVADLSDGRPVTLYAHSSSDSEFLALYTQHSAVTLDR